MLIVKLERDHARSVQENFFPYLVMLCDNKIDHAGRDELLNCRLIHSLFLEVKMIFDKKLLTTSNTLTFKLTIAQGIVFFNLLLDLPINSTQIFLINLRSHIIDTLHQQLSEPI